MRASSIPLTRPVVAGALVALLASLACTSPAPEPPAETGGRFPKELVDWVPYEGNPLFAGTGGDTWDREIRERGFILREGATWRLWYTGYNSGRADTLSLGYATSPDGLEWTRHPDNPVFDRTWTEDVHVLKHDEAYVMFAEGKGDIAHLLTSADGVSWEDQGSLDVRTRSGEPLSPARTGPRRPGWRTAPGSSSTSGGTRGSGWPPRPTGRSGRTCRTSR